MVGPGLQCKQDTWTAKLRRKTIKEEQLKEEAKQKMVDQQNKKEQQRRDQQQEKENRRIEEEKEQDRVKEYKLAKLKELFWAAFNEYQLGANTENDQQLKNPIRHGQMVEDQTNKEKKCG